MPEHYTRNTVAASFWCNKCGKETMHRIDGTRRGPCLDCMKKLEEAPKREPPAQQGGLF